MRLIKIAGLAGVLSATASPAFAALFIVDNSVRDAGDWNPGDGVCAYNSTPGNRCNLRAAVQEANALPGRDVILIPDGWRIVLTSIGHNEDGAATGDLDVLEDLGIGSFAPHGAWPIVDANQLDRVFDVHPPATLDIAQLEITGGRTTSRGGGFYVRPGAELEASNCTIRDNRGSGGGVTNEGTTSIESCLIGTNHALNSFDAPSALYLLAGSMTITKSTVTGNYAANAAIRAVSNTGLTITNSTIADNLGIGANLSTGLGIDSTGDVVLRNVTITGHRATGFSISLIGAFSSPSVRNSIIADNGTDCSISTPGGLTDINHPNLDSDGSCGFSPAFGGLPNTDPQLGPLQPNGGPTPTRVPKVGSPVIDVGENGSCTTDDQRGVPRPLDGGAPLVATCDLGAIEDLPCDTAAVNLLVTNTALGNGESVACHQILAGPAVEVQPGAIHAFRARDRISLFDGFTVRESATFQVMRDPAAGSSVSIP